MSLDLEKLKERADGIYAKLSPLSIDQTVKTMGYRENDPNAQDAANELLANLALNMFDHSDPNDSSRIVLAPELEQLESQNFGDTVIILIMNGLMISEDFENMYIKSVTEHLEKYRDFKS